MCNTSFFAFTLSLRHITLSTKPDLSHLYLNKYLVYLFYSLLFKVNGRNLYLFDFAQALRGHIVSRGFVKWAKSGLNESF